MIRVLIVHGPTSPRQGGTLTFLRNVVSRLPADRFDVTLLFLEGGGIADDFRRDGVRVEILEAGRLRRVDRLIRTVAAIRRVIADRAVSLVFSNGAYEHIYGGAAAWAAGLPAMWYCHGASTGFDVVRTVALLIPSRVVLTHSHYTRSLLPSRPVPVVVVPLGIDANGSGAERAAIRAQLGIAGDTPVIAMVGVFMPWKGQDVFLKAASIIRTRMPSARFVLVGDAPFERHRAYAESLRHLAADLGMADHVSFLGYREDGSAVMAAADVVVHASIEPEPFGLVLLEAMASGRALVTTGVGGAAEIVSPGESALVVSPGDAGALADACIRLLTDHALREHVAAAGLRRVREKFTIGPMIDSLAAQLAHAARTD